MKIVVPVKLVPDLVEEISIDPDQASPLVLFAAETLTNAYKHAFIEKGGGFIAVSLKPCGHEGDYLFRIDDNGIGYSPEQAIDDDQGSMGTQLIRAFVKQLGGELTIGPRDEGGTRVDLKVKLIPHV